jgi:hypothetical protein
MLCTEANIQDPFDLELRYARWIMLGRGELPDLFRIMRTPRKGPSGHVYVREYTVTVSRRGVPPVTYERTDGKDWVALFAYDLAKHRFSEDQTLSGGLDHRLGDHATA